jgi:hypothetical protein
MRLEDFSEVSLIIAMREYNQYALLLVHNGNVLIEGPMLGYEYYGFGAVAEAFFETIAAEAKRVIAMKKVSGGRWIGDGKREDIWEVD